VLQALRELFLKIGGTGGWVQGGGIVDTILATVEDYLGEYLTYLQPAFAARYLLIIMRSQPCCAEVSALEVNTVKN
jgi:hypothetical protein